MTNEQSFYYGRHWTGAVLMIAVILSVGFLGVYDAVAYDRTVLVEDYTNTSCGPCATYTPHVLAGLEDFEQGDEYALISFHVNWPGRQDPWFLANEDENRGMWQDRGVNAVPRFFIDGTYHQLYNPPESNAARTRDAVQRRLGQDSPLQIEIVAMAGEQLSTNVTINSEENLDDLILHIALVEHLVQYQAPNGQREHHGPMLDMITGNGGYRFDASANEPFEHSFESSLDLDVQGHDMDQDNFRIIAWVETSNQQVLQAFESELWSGPLIEITEWELTDDGNDDGRAEPGETAEITLTLRNSPDSMPAENVVVEMACDYEGIEIQNGRFEIEALDVDEEFVNAEDPLSFTVADDFTPHSVTFTISITSDPGGLTTEVPLTFVVGWPDVLLVDASDSPESHQAMLAVFDTENIPFAEQWDRTADGEITEELVSNYPVVLYFSHNLREGMISDAEEEVLMSYLDHGGTLIMTGSYMLTNLTGHRLFSEYLRVELELDNVSRGTTLFGVEDDPHFDGAELYLGRGQAGSSSRKPSVTLLEGAEGIFVYEVDETKIGAAKHETGTYNTMFFAFALETAAGYFDSDDLSVTMGRILDWVDYTQTSAPYGEEVAPATFELAQAFPNPFNSSVTIPFSLDADNYATLTLYDLSGREIATILAGDITAGRHSLTFDASSVGLASGVYYLRLSSGEQVQGQKLLYLR